MLPLARTFLYSFLGAILAYRFNLPASKSSPLSSLLQRCCSLNPNPRQPSLSTLAA
jgi:hypothetical protein